MRKHKRQEAVVLTAEQEKECTKHLLSQLRPCDIFYAIRPKSLEQREWIRYDLLSKQNICETLDNSPSNCKPCIE
jgi:hypothetical protein